MRIACPNAWTTTALVAKRPHRCDRPVDHDGHCRCACGRPGPARAKR